MSQLSFVIFDKMMYHGDFSSNTDNLHTMLYQDPIITSLPYQREAVLQLCQMAGSICLREPGCDRIFINPRAIQSFNQPSTMRDWVIQEQGHSLALFYISYDAALEDMGFTAKPSAIHLPLAGVQLYDGYLEVDHESCTLTSYALTPSIVEQHIAAFRKKAIAPPDFRFTGPLRSNFCYADYEQAFHQAREGLLQGDHYQVNLAQRFQIQMQGSALALFEALTQKSPSFFDCFWPVDDHTSIVCHSPEEFIRIEQGRISSMPIKGTAKRSPDPLVDAQHAQALASSEKDRAENLMIVDLMRNDLGKIAIPGSVKVDKLFEIMTLSYAHHLVSTVSARLPKELHPLDALLACFPGGSITGAPKRAAIQAIHKLEPHPRHIYCGTIGYLSAQGSLRSNIAIRTAIVQDQLVSFWAGGGLVLDSDVRAEYEECMTKIAPMMQLIRNREG